MAPHQVSGLSSDRCTSTGQLGTQPASRWRSAVWRVLTERAPSERLLTTAMSEVAHTVPQDHRQVVPGVFGAIVGVGMPWWNRKPEDVRAQWVLEPLVGVGPLRFGMNPDQVASALDGATAYVSTGLDGGAGWGCYSDWGVTAVLARPHPGRRHPARTHRPADRLRRHPADRHDGLSRRRSPDQAPRRTRDRPDHRLRRRSRAGRSQHVRTGHQSRGRRGQRGAVLQSGVGRPRLTRKTTRSLRREARRAADAVRSGWPSRSNRMQNIHIGPQDLLRGPSYTRRWPRAGTTNAFRDNLTDRPDTPPTRNLDNPPRAVARGRRCATIPRSAPNPSAVVGFGEVVEADGFECGLGDAFGAVEDRGDRGLPDESGQAPDSSHGPLAEIGGVTGKRPGPVRPEIECGLYSRDQFSEGFACAEPCRERPAFHEGSPPRELRPAYPTEQGRLRDAAGPRSDAESRA